MFNKIFHVLLVLAMLVPSLSSAIEEYCDFHELSACHQATESHESDCPNQHMCCHGPAYVVQALIVFTELEKNTDYNSNFFFSITSNDLEGPFQPPKA